MYIKWLTRHHHQGQSDEEGNAVPSMREFSLLLFSWFISTESLLIHGYWDADRAQTWPSVKRSRELEPQHSSSEITETSLSPLKL